MIPFRFGPPTRQLFGAYHPAIAASSTGNSVLLCNPFGQEAIRTHRLLQVLAERLARSGTPVLRFDYHGTGDSSGDDTDGQLDLWQEDILNAHHELQRRAMCQRVSWLGVRLGASLAALASVHAKHQPEHVVLWEPIARGGAYLDSLATYHRKALASSYGVVPKGYRGAAHHEAVGFGISPVLHQQLSTLDATLWPALRAPQVSLITPSRSKDSSLWGQVLKRTEGSCQHIAFDHGFDWVSEEALNTALVPAEALTLMLSVFAPNAVPDPTPT